MFLGPSMCLSELLIIRSGDTQCWRSQSLGGALQVHFQCLVPGLGTLCSLLLEGDSEVTRQGDFLGLFAQPKFHLSPWDWCFLLAVSGPLVYINNRKTMAQILIHMVFRISKSSPCFKTSCWPFSSLDFPVAVLPSVRDCFPSLFPCAFGSLLATSVSQCWRLRETAKVRIVARLSY